MKKIILATMLSASFLGLTAMAEDNLGNKIGTAIEENTDKTADSVKDVTKEAMHGTADAAKKTGDAVDKAGDKIEDASKKVVEDVKKDSKEVVKDIKESF